MPDQLRVSDAKFSHYILHFDDKNFFCGSQSSKQLELLIAFTVSRISRVESKIFFLVFLFAVECRSVVISVVDQ